MELSCILTARFIESGEDPSGGSSPAVPPLKALKSGEPQERPNGIRLWSISGERMTLNYVEMPPGAITEVDQHDNEQINYILEGTAALRLGTNPTDMRLGPGEVVVIPSKVSHQFRAAGTQPLHLLGMLSPARKLP